MKVVADATKFARGSTVRHVAEVWPEDGGWSMLVYTWRREGVCGPSSDVVPMKGKVMLESIDETLFDLGWTRLGDWSLERGGLVAKVVPNDPD